MDLTDEMADLFFGTCFVICENSIVIEVSMSMSMENSQTDSEEVGICEEYARILNQQGQ